MPEAKIPVPEKAFRINSDKNACHLIIACGALAKEIVFLIKSNGWTHIDLDCLPAALHNRPQHIPERLAQKIEAAKDRYQKIFIAYGDCGTAGGIDALLEEGKVERIAGPHCYSFYAGDDAFDALQESELGSFYLTDYLARHFDTLIIKGLGIDRRPEFLNVIFGNYKRLVYLAQTKNSALEKKAKEAAEKLKLDYHYHYSGYGELASFIKQAEIKA